MNKMETDTTTLMAVLMVFAAALEDCTKVVISGKINELSKDEQDSWLFNYNNLLVAKPFYEGIYQAVSAHAALKAQFSREFAYFAQQLKFVDMMLSNPKMQMILSAEHDVSPKSTVH
ncbi:hypothetical protein [Alysiella crassa]|uniref:Uncharacterized protein n=1 Tax=Alysiella crassa TaxID=153491 RepID=A0A376BWD9_9NEIS|nr:hypothetical protein [Alysiella crassa]UOP06190.1 hypothetical protein LVJ80_10190 [Alysiella crassa]SSY80664.1 Uncharacterised protein [Alysiella crassa]